MADSPLIQNFSVSAGDAVDIDIDVASDDDDFTLLDCTIFWRAYRQQYGVPTVGVDPIIEKALSAGLSVVNPTALQVRITLTEANTISLLGNYYHELTIVDGDGKRSTPTVGIMTVTQTENRFA